MKILAALHSVLSTLSTEGIEKSRNNQQQNYKFRGIDDIYNSISGLFAKYKILPLPRYTDVFQTERESGSGKAIFVTRLNGYFKLKSLEDGSDIEIGPFPGEAMDSADKSTNKAMSASFKYALLQTFVIPTEGDNDADATTHDVRTRQVDRGPATAGEQQQTLFRPQPDFHGSTGNVRAGEAAVVAADDKRKNHPMMLQLSAALNKYGAEKRPIFEQKIAEALGFKTIYDIPPARLPEAILAVVQHQKKVVEARKAAAAAAKPAKPKPTKAAPPPPDSDEGPDQLIDNTDDGDDGIPV